MAARKAFSRLSCAGCGANISEPTMWVDDCGLLCRQCAMLSRTRRMKGEGAGLGPRDRAPGTRGRVGH